MSTRGVGESLARLVVRAAARSVPIGKRERFIREWDAELWQAARSDASVGPRPVRMAFGAFADARAMSSWERHGRVGVIETIDGFFTDVRVAARGLRRVPGFAVVAVLTLGLGLGATTAMMTIVDTVVLRPLPYPEPERLVQLKNEVPGVGDGTVWGMSTAQYVHIVDEVPAFSEVGLYRGFGGNLDTPEGPVRASGWRVTADLLPMLGATAVHGRLFLPHDDQGGAPLTLILSEEYWRSRFGADPSVVGRTLSTGGLPVTVIGVLADGFRLPQSPAGMDQVYLPLQIDRAGRFANSHVNRMIARLADAQTVESADVVLQGTLPRLLERFPDAYGGAFLGRYGFRPFATPLKEEVLGSVANNLWILLGGVAFVLLIAVANATNLFVVRIEERGKDLQVRSALGAGVGTLSRYLAAEAFVIVAAAVVVALAVGVWGVPALLVISPSTLPRMDEVRMTGTGVVATLAMAALAFSLLLAYPMAVHVRSAVRRPVDEGFRNSTAGRSRTDLRSVLIVAQVALALTLASSAGLLIESTRKMGAIDLGFDPSRSMTVEVYLEPSRYDSETAVWQAHQLILEKIRALPGVEGAGATSSLPLSGDFGCTVQGFDDQALLDRLRRAGLTTCAGQTYATPGYFEAMGIPVLLGRSFRDADNDDPSRASVIVSEAFVERFWPGEDAVGKRVGPSGRAIEPFYNVVGVVGDIPDRTVDGDPAMAIYYPIVTAPGIPPRGRHLHMSFAVRTGRADPLSVFPSVRDAIREVDPSAPVADPVRSSDRVAESMARITFVSTLLQLAAGTALLLSAIGMYGVISYLVGRRTREIGMRLALGAEPRQIRRQIVARSAQLAAIGLIIGLGLTLMSTRVLESLLYGVGPRDPLVLSVSMVVLAGVAALASWIPARRASRIDPIEALRME